MQKRVFIESIVLGFVFLLSGIIKSTDSTRFIQIIETYDIKYIEYFAPAIIIIEIYLGLCLITEKNRYQASILGLTFLFFISTVYIYGWIFKDVTACGCFGKLGFFEDRPWLTILRNIALSLMCADIIIYHKKYNIKDNLITSIELIKIIIIALGAFFCGYTTKFSNNKFVPFEAHHIRDSKIREYVTTSPDSSYLVFAFSYTCPHCINSIGNLSQYEKSGVVDRVIPLAIEDEKAETAFNNFFNLEFKIKHFSKERMLELTKAFPIAYYIKKDTVVDAIKGELPSAYLFKAIYNINVH